MAKKNQADETAKLLAQAGGTGGSQEGADQSTAQTGQGGVGQTGDTDTGAQHGDAGQSSGQDGQSGGDVTSQSGALTEGEIAAQTPLLPGGPALHGIEGHDWSLESGGELAFRATGDFVLKDVVVKRVQARVLVDGRFGKVNQVVSVTDEELEAGKGELCAHPASVAYAKSL